MTQQPLLLVYTKKDNDSLNLEPSLMNCSPVLTRTISRLRCNPDVFHFAKASETVEEIMRTPSQKLSWEACCFQRAQDLLRLNKDRYYISYSGGIDSTAILVAIMETWSKQDLERVVVLLSKTSIEENPTFFNRVAAHFQMQSSLQNMSSLLAEKNAILVTGEMGDQIFGSIALHRPWLDYGDRIFINDYKDLVPRILEGMILRSNGIPPQVFHRFAPIIEECPFPIRTTFDFFWWLNFSQKWQFVKFRFLQNDDWDLRAKYGEQVLHFYDTVSFQQWSLENHDLKIRNDWDSYKFTSKEFIYKYTGDAEQLKLRKIQSLLKTFTFNKKRMAIRSDYQVVDSVEELETYVRSH